MDFEVELPDILCDRERIIQVIINLISNAVKFTDYGSITCRVKRNNDELIVSIMDTGMGISSEDCDKVFEKFKQLGNSLSNKMKGTGLGLSICKQIIDYHKGRIWVESEPGKGSNFSFSIPLN